MSRIGKDTCGPMSRWVGVWIYVLLTEWALLAVPLETQL